VGFLCSNDYMLDIDIINALSEIGFDRPIDYIFTGVAFCYIAWLAWFIKNDRV